MTPFEVPRPDLVDSLRARASGPPFLLAGPPGCGKTWLLLALKDRLERQGALPIYLDLMGAASSPDRFVESVLAALPAAPLAETLPAATKLKLLAGSGREQASEAVLVLFRLLGTLTQAGTKPVVLLLDAATEVRSLAYYKGLRDVHEPFHEAMVARPAGTVLATAFPTLAARLFPTCAVQDAPSLTADDLRRASPALRASYEPGDVIRLTGGWPRYVRALWPRLQQGISLDEAWEEEMSPGGALEQACRYTYETLLLRSRGYGMSKAVLAAVAREDGLNLTALVARLGRTPGAIRDYLQWLVDVDILRRDRKRYRFADPLVRQWVRLNAQGQAPSRAAIRSVLRDLRGDTVAAEPQPAEPRPEAAPPPRRDSLMEID